MGYKKAGNVLPEEIIKIIQEYIDGECIYIPKKEENKAQWGSKTNSKTLLMDRNINIYKDYLNGMKYLELAEKYFLSPKSIERIVLQGKRA